MAYTLLYQTPPGFHLSRVLCGEDLTRAMTGLSLSTTKKNIGSTLAGLFFEDPRVVEVVCSALEYQDIRRLMEANRSVADQVIDQLSYALWLEGDDHNKLRIAHTLHLTIHARGISEQFKPTIISRVRESIKRNDHPKVRWELEFSLAELEGRCDETFETAHWHRLGDLQDEITTYEASKSVLPCAA